MKDAWGYSNEHHPVAKASWLVVWLLASIYLYIWVLSLRLYLPRPTAVRPSLPGGSLDTEKPVQCKSVPSRRERGLSCFLPPRTAKSLPGNRLVCLQKKEKEKETKDSKVDLPCVWKYSNYNLLSCCRAELHQPPLETTKGMADSQSEAERCLAQVGRRKSFWKKCLIVCVALASV